MENVYDKTISIRTSVLFDVLGKLGYPNPEDPDDDDWGPWGPYVRKILVGAIFGPVPDPWIVQGIAKSLQRQITRGGIRGNGYPNPEDPDDDDWGPFGPYIHKLIERLDPQPSPLFALHMADTFIESVVELDNIAQAAPNFEDAIYGGIVSELNVFIDECGTKWPGWWKRKLKKKIPPPPPPYDKPNAIDLVVLATKFHDFAAGMDNQHRLKPIFVEAAENLLEQGLGRLS